MNGKTAFIYNPKAGNKSSRNRISAMKAYVEKHGHDFFATEYKGHASEIAESIHKEVNKIIVAGGDGTINEVATVLVNTDTSMGIIPMGSGNGLANHLGISSNPHKALEQTEKPPSKVDVITLNEKVIVNVGGLGFDSQIAYLFNKSENRGAISYIKLIIAQLSKFKEFTYSLDIDGINKSGEAFIIAITNGSEFGNRFKVDPGAQIDDGRLSVIVIKKPPLYRLPGLLLDGYRGTLKESFYYQKFSTDEAKIAFHDLYVHRDGEVDEDQDYTELIVKILPKALNLIY